MNEKINLDSIDKKFYQESESIMKADYINNIIESYDKSPYECILIDGPWGVGKSYAIKEALKNNNNVCNISMFGLKDAQEIYHEVFFQLAMKDKKKIRILISKVINAYSTVSGKMATIKGVIESLVTEKELFLNISKGFSDLHFIIIDDLERMNYNINLQEVFGIIDELKRCNYVKVILVANTKEISQKELFHQYSEKVIDRTYSITERPEKVYWANLKIHHAFITEFLSKHPVKNLRTLQKAQNLYDDIRLRLQNSYKDEFYTEIRLACYAIVVETIDNLYYRMPDSNQTDTMMKFIQESQNKLESRIINYYLQGTKISNNMVEILQKYYENKFEINADEIDAEYQIFIHAGDKANYYKSDDELKQVLPSLAQNVIQETNIAKMLRYADEYFIWNEHLQLDTDQLKKEYQSKLCNMIYKEIMNGNIEYLTYGVEVFHIQSQTNKNIVKEVNQTVKNKAIDEYVRYLSGHTHGEQAYQYSYTLRRFVDNAFFKDAISRNVNALYNEKSLPIHDVTEQQYRTAYNIMYVLYHENKDKFLAYCDEAKTRCDNMAVHRINVLLKEITGEN